jgi:predicted helicase
MESRTSERAPAAVSSPELRARYGLHLTPAPLARYVVRSVDLLLRSRLGWGDGIADRRVRLLDPAAGPMTFIAEVWRLAAAGAGTVGGELHAFEVLPGPFLAGRLAMRRLLAELGGPIDEAERISFHLTDALRLGGEAGRARTLKLEEPISVVLGNPPWSGHSNNRDPWIEGLLRGYTLPDGRRDEGYYRVDGAPLGERNPKWLQDDCVKFLRLAQWKIDQNGEGVVGFVMSHTCLEAPTFRGLRRSLLRSFEEIYALDLHGDRRKRERTPDGRKDENVFPGVGQGAAVLFLVKKAGLRKRVFRADLFGTRREKLDALAATDLGSPPWREVVPRKPAYLFTASGRALEREYERGLPLPGILPVHSTGVVTGRDALYTAVDRHGFERRIGPLLRGQEQAAPDWPRQITSFLVRPFDLRHLLYAERLLARPRRSVMEHLRGRSNCGLVVSRQSKEPFGCLATRWVTGHKAVSAYDVSSVFPLYRFIRNRDSGAWTRVPNLARETVDGLGERYGEIPSPEDVLGYVYAVLWSPPYRARYRTLLARDYPRVRFPEDRAGFFRLAQLGRELVALHLLEDARLQEPPLRCESDPRRPPGAGFEYQENEGRLLAGGVAFVGLAPDVWHYRIGGYQVLASFLRARAGTTLTHEESRDFRRTAAAIAATVELEGRLTAVYAETTDL